LIDTHILIWHLVGDAQLSPARWNLIADPDNKVLISIASLWEIAIKLSRGKLAISMSIEDVISCIERSTSSLAAIEPEHLIIVASLPFHHRDPFDRLIISQALIEGIPILTSDSNFAYYGVELL
jgi:PIN domain nuclease of toxin-antitoxin system